ncbi:MAG TPA: CYTH and CHAD domain-containing protein [Jatrophihabitans sp.]|uniref:CYTH and CHAD domain-containing protein n=1 Tax=Jatrophihabitans sp. TaxID=1932789 RepID=UPI002F23B235
MADTHREIETKFDVAPDFTLGDLAEFARPGTSVQSRVVNLSSAYFDTAEHNLLRSRLTLRRRTGDSDTGWHLKVPGAGFRTELHWPLAGNDEAPEELRSLIWPFVAAAELLPTVILNTTRTSHRVTAPDGRLVFELADDEVRAVSEGAQVAAPRWRELEVELGPAGSTADLERATELLLARGAFASRSASKLQRALGRPDDPDTDSAGAVLTSYLRAQCDSITAGHFAISDKPFEASASSQPHEAIHQTRVATRRLRAALRIFAPLFDAELAARLQEELTWFAAELGEVRDREVLRSRLARAVEDLPAYLVVGPVAQRIDEVLLTELRHHADALLATMRDERYQVLVQDLALWRERPPFTPQADSPPEALAQYVAAAEDKLAKRMRRATGNHTPAEQLHQARKAGKRARYAAEAAAPALGKSASKIAKRAAKLQTLLGEHQDAIVATELLRRIADQVADEGENAFTYGILVADQRRIAASSAQAARASTVR